MATNQKQTVALIDLAVADGKDQRTTRVESALRRLDGLTLLEWCIRRLSESTLIETIVVTGPPQFRELISQTGLCNARWMPSALSTPSQRAKELADRLCADWIVFSSPLCPFTDPMLLDRLVSRGWANPGVDFVGFVSPNRPNFSLQSLGLVGEMCSANAIAKLARENLLGEPCDVPEVIRRNPAWFQTKLIPLPEELNHSDLRFLMESEADWDRAHSYLEAAGDDLSWQRLAQLAERNFSVRF
jgi:spore coat polysaccharide biosynthesis protein SpsF (cytidylyltransferase family)